MSKGMKRSGRLALAIAALLTVLAVSGPSWADNDWNDNWNWRHNQGWDNHRWDNNGWRQRDWDNDGWRNRGWGNNWRHDNWGHNWGHNWGNNWRRNPSFVFVYPQPYYQPQPYYYQPQPYYYQPRPYYYRPYYQGYYRQPSFNFVIPLHID